MNDLDSALTFDALVRTIGSRKDFTLYYNRYRQSEHHDAGNACAALVLAWTMNTTIARTLIDLDREPAP